MNETVYCRGKTVRYLVWTFAVAYALQAVAWILWTRVGTAAGQAAVAASMFAPALGVLLSGAGFGGMGWKPRIRKNIRTILFAWLSPAVLTAAGAALYFLVFPSHFDLGGSYIAAAAGEEALKMMEEQGLTYDMYLIITAVSAVLYAPFINTIFALGEETGWRGFLYPQLKARFGKRKGVILGGVIWGAWHWPLIWLIGYEYGSAAGNSAGYAGFPVTGMVLFCAVTAVWGVIHDRVYEKSGSIWIPALLHGAINAAATLPLAVCITDTGSARLLGPAPMGIISILPFLAVALFILIRHYRGPAESPGRRKTKGK